MVGEVMNIKEFLGKKKSGNPEPRKLFIISQPKVGKTILAAQLPNSFILDLESGTKSYDCASIDIRKEALISKKSELEVLSKAVEALKNLPNLEKPDYLIVDTTTALEDLANILALKKYKQTAMGKAYTGADVCNLPQGAGYGWLREAFKLIYDEFDLCCNKCVIYLGHAKTGSINKDGKDLTAKDVSLTGKLKTIFTSDMDANGFLYRKGNTNENWISFITQEQDLFSGSRTKYLAGKEFKISEIKDEELITYWDVIFPSLNK